MSNNEKELINMIRENDNPTRALMTATLIVLGYLKQHESFEEQVVVGTVQREITNLEALDGQLIIIKETLEKLSKIPVKLDVKLLDNNIDENTQRIIEGLKNSINEIYTENFDMKSGLLKSHDIVYK